MLKKLKTLKNFDFQKLHLFVITEMISFSLISCKIFRLVAKHSIEKIMARYLHQQHWLSENSEKKLLIFTFFINSIFQIMLLCNDRFDFLGQCPNQKLHTLKILH